MASLRRSRALSARSTRPVEEYASTLESKNEFRCVLWDKFGSENTLANVEQTGARGPPHLSFACQPTSTDCIEVALSALLEDRNRASHSVSAGSGEPAEGTMAGQGSMYQVCATSTSFHVVKVLRR
jgi:hypothetical protein